MPLFRMDREIRVAAESNSITCVFTYTVGFGCERLIGSQGECI
jgi:hypothetical protein